MNRDEVFLRIYYPGYCVFGPTKKHFQEDISTSTSNKQRHQIGKLMYFDGNIKVLCRTVLVMLLVKKYQQVRNRTSYYFSVLLPVSFFILLQTARTSRMS